MTDISQWTAVQHAQALLDHYIGVEGHVTVCVAPEFGKVISVDPAVDAAKLVDKADTGDVYLRMSTMSTLPDSGRGGANLSAGLAGVWCDLDYQSETHKAEELPTRDQVNEFLEHLPTPTLLVDTSGGLHAHWMLTRPAYAVDGVDFAAVLDRWHAGLAALADEHGLGHLDNVSEPARLLRLPGTLNHKWSKLDMDPRKVRVIAQTDERHTLPDLRAFADVAVQRLRDRSPQATATPSKTTSNGASAFTTPDTHADLDAWEKATSWSTILQGWTEVGTDAAGVLWKRPGDPTSDYSARSGLGEGGGLLHVHSTMAPGLKENTTYSKFQAFTQLAHGGDTAAASAAVRARYGTKTSTSTDSAPVSSQTAFIDWTSFWDTERRDEDWLYQDVFARGRGHALYASHKAGKSLLMLAIAAELATGPDNIAVVYLDYEMTEDDLAERLTDMGYGPESDLSRLRYALLPTLPPLDTADGSAALSTILDGVEADHEGAHLLVAIDTTARAVAGEENSSDTFRAFYNHTGIALKRRGATWARLDHAGKDGTKGQRGSSAKGDDVDLVWRLAKTDRGVTLRRDLSRMRWVPETVSFAIDEEPLAYRPVVSAWPEGTETTGRLLDRLGVPADASRRDAQATLKEAGQGRRTGVVNAALKWRRTRPAELVSIDGDDDETRSGTTSGTTPAVSDGNHLGNHHPKTAETSGGNHLGTTGNHRPGAHGNQASPVRGTLVPVPTSDTQTTNVDHPQIQQPAADPDGPDPTPGKIVSALPAEPCEACGKDSAVTVDGRRVHAGTCAQGQAS